MSPADSLTAAPDFDRLVARLATLSRNHLLFFRIEVGRTVAAGFLPDVRTKLPGLIFGVSQGRSSPLQPDYFGVMAVSTGLREGSTPTMCAK